MFSRPEPPVIQGLPPAEQRIHDEEIRDRFDVWRTQIDTAREMWRIGLARAMIRRINQEADMEEEGQ